ncbi:hypothetical protein XSR1_90013 [Xenorhabdus szentirmaii DSM 16338]|uniref:Uncharacterized protein n=1 Tax=Xenorhabdus szentirmaii DSM 16338 TaxID=1427518 RepID=W1J4H8_9GAMM|nr:hypothetical protein XSR1_90013 [Xenorhabdus szentirmaii DSM 16338]
MNHCHSFMLARLFNQITSLSYIVILLILIYMLEKRPFKIELSHRDDRVKLIMMK